MHACMERSRCSNKPQARIRNVNGNQTYVDERVNKILLVSGQNQGRF